MRASENTQKSPDKRTGQLAPLCPVRTSDRTDRTNGLFIEPWQGLRGHLASDKIPDKTKECRRVRPVRLSRRRTDRTKPDNQTDKKEIEQ